MKSRTKFDSQLDPFAVKGPSALTYLSNLGDWQELRDPNARTTKTELKHLNEIRDGGKELTPIDLYPGGPRQLKKIDLGCSSESGQFLLHLGAIYAEMVFELRFGHVYKSSMEKG